MHTTFYSSFGVVHICFDRVVRIWRMIYCVYRLCPLYWTGLACNVKLGPPRWCFFVILISSAWVICITIILVLVLPFIVTSAYCSVIRCVCFNFLSSSVNELLSQKLLVNFNGVLIHFLQSTIN